jgi:hypothetical protein
MNRPENCKQGNTEERKMKFTKGKVTWTIDSVIHCLVQSNVQVLCNDARGI